MLDLFSPFEVVLIIFFIFIVIMGLFTARHFIRRDQRRRTTSLSRGQMLINRYKIERELGRGMNAIAYLVEDSKRPEESFVAKLLLTPEDDPRISRASFKRHNIRFNREMENLQKLKNCNFVVPVHEFHFNSITPFYVMKYCDRTLEDEINHYPIPMKKILKILIDICSGLKEIHQLNMVHRDLKPANILFHDNKWVLADFGMSLLSGQNAMITVSDSIPGTIPFTAPEVMYYQPDNIKPSADIFSLGITLKKMLTGSHDWGGKTSEFLPRSVREEISHEIALFDDLIDNKMTSLLPTDRLQTINDFINEIEIIFKELNRKRLDSVKIDSKELNRLQII